MIANCTSGEPAFSKMLKNVVQELQARGRMMVTAESCSGVWIAKCCTDVAGSSAWLDRGVRYLAGSESLKRRKPQVRI